uniref:Uncharacterized protein n=1 Tax=Acanthochromis polyacanthus TaxID=80966 RepID=A0A3Q1GRT1_9TELE
MFCELLGEGLSSEEKYLRPTALRKGYINAGGVLEEESVGQEDKRNHEMSRNITSQPEAPVGRLEDSTDLNFQISTSDTTESKSTLLNIEASLKASFLAGLVEVEGSAKYLNDQKRFKNQSRVTFQYKATTNFKQLNMADLSTLDKEQKSIIQRSSATHVVTAILYGANAFFVFDSEKVEADSVQKIEGSMRALIKKIPAFDVEGKVELKLTDEEKALTQKFSCKFYGDFILESNPSTFEEAVKTYAGLPKLLGEGGENSVPLTIWMMPLKNLDPEVPDLINDISVAVITNQMESRYQTELERELLTPNAGLSYCFVFTSLETADPCLDDMRNYLDGQKSGSSKPTYISDDVIKQMRKKAYYFKSFENRVRSSFKKFLVTAILNKKYPGASIYKYEQGVLVDDNFQPPSNQ